MYLIFKTLLFTFILTVVNALALSNDLPKDINQKLKQFELSQSEYNQKSLKLSEQEQIFKRYHKSIKRLKNASDVVSNIKLNNQYQKFQNQAKYLESLRNKKNQAKLLLDQKRNTLLQTIDQYIIAYKQQPNAHSVRHLKDLTDLYDEYTFLESSLSNSDSPIVIPQELDPDSLIALQDLLSNVEKKIVLAERNLKHSRRKQFINTSMMDTLAEESFFSESQFINPGNVEEDNASAVNALQGNTNDSIGEGSPDNSTDNVDLSEELSLGTDILPVRDINTIEAKRQVQKQNLSENDHSIYQNIQSQEARLIFLKAERLKILNELQKQ